MRLILKILLAPVMLVPVSYTHLAGSGDIQRKQHKAVRRLRGGFRPTLQPGEVLPLSLIHICKTSPA